MEAQIVWVAAKRHRVAERREIHTAIAVHRPIVAICHEQDVGAGKIGNALRLAQPFDTMHDGTGDDA